jgi:hypothetical protein
MTEDDPSTVEHPDVVVVDAMGVRTEAVSGRHRQDTGHRVGVPPHDSVRHTFEVSERLGW